MALNEEPFLLLLEMSFKDGWSLLPLDVGSNSGCAINRVSEPVDTQTGV